VKFGAVFSNLDLGTDFGVIRDVVQGLDDAGLDFFSTNDHVVGGHPERAQGQRVHTSAVAVHEPLVLLSFVGAVTRRLELVTFVLLLPQRQTTLVAKQVAELDLLSGGRVRLGVGVGRNWMEYEALNEEFRTRGARIEEQVEVLRRYWTEPHVTFEGRWHHLDRVGLNPMPVQRPVPIWMGSFFGGVVERVIERIGRLADGWMPQFPPDDEFAATLGRLRGYATAAGRDPATIGVECGIRIAKGDDPASWLETARAFQALGATHLRVMAAGGGYASPLEQRDDMLRWREAMSSLG
jgi:probable F420-dependent oxidoreductase